MWQMMITRILYRRGFVYREQTSGHQRGEELGTGQNRWRGLTVTNYQLESQSVTGLWDAPQGIKPTFYDNIVWCVICKSIQSLSHMPETNTVSRLYLNEPFFLRICFPCSRMDRSRRWFIQHPNCFQAQCRTERFPTSTSLRRRGCSFLPLTSVQRCSL